MRLFLAIVIVFLSIGCSRDLPKGILPPEKMELIVYDLVRIDEFINNYVVKDTTVNVKMKRSTLYEQAFKVHNTTRKEFYTSFRYYQQNPRLQKNLFDSLQHTINKKAVVSGRVDSATKVR